ncbi:uncharacterized protein At4g04775-like [Vicia villosa]|uniref:uncharacterized protein At4g04775-like n=1 Tax=Vicia villosa TaxID=3911 RepID=UPI00273BF2FA|nr:uncharacterized protein At4g04775-like [Vicia villosa]
MSGRSFSFASTNQSGLRRRRRGSKCWCEIESPLMTSWTYENPGRRFHGCGNYKVMGKKGCNYFEWVDDDMSNRAKDMIRYLKNKNDEVMDLMRDTQKKEDLLKMKIRFMGYYLVLMKMVCVFSQCLFVSLIIVTCGTK